MKNIIPFKSSKTSSQDTKLDDDSVDSGKLGGMDYVVYKRGVIHISDAEGCLFKKDIEIFSEEIEKLNFNKLKIGECYTLPGSGDNDDLIFTMGDTDVEISLKKKGFKTLEKLKSLLKRKGQ